MALATLQQTKQVDILIFKNQVLNTFYFKQYVYKTSQLSDKKGNDIHKIWSPRKLIIISYSINSYTYSKKHKHTL